MDVSDVINSASDPAFSIDDRARIVEWNDGAEKVLGYTAAEVAGLPCFDVVGAILNSGEPVCTPLCQGLDELGCCLPYAVPSCMVVHKDGHQVPISISTIAFPLASRASEKDNSIAVVFLRPDRPTADLRSPSEQIRIYTLGRFHIVIGDHGIAFNEWERKQSLTLFRLLVANRGHLMHREQLIDVLWPDGDDRQVRERLKVTIYSLRQQLARAGLDGSVIETVGSSYGLKEGPIWIDADAYGRLIAEGAIAEKRGDIDKALSCFEAAVELYRGDYFDDETYADWCAQERERLREMHLELLVRMADLYARQGNYLQAVESCRTALTLEPCREGAHRALMENLARLGQAELAMVQYRRCKRLLEEEFGVEPMAETTHLYERVLAGYNAVSSGQLETAL